MRIDSLPQRERCLCLPRRPGSLSRALTGSFLLTLLPLLSADLTYAPAAAEPPLIKERVEELAAPAVAKPLYLKEAHFPLLANERVRVVRYTIKRRWNRDTFLPTRLPIFYLRLRLEAADRQGVPMIKLQTSDFGDEAAIQAALDEFFSPVPLEDQLDWSPEIRWAVRNRFLALGMDKEMAQLTLGGFPYENDSEVSEDGRMKETWKLQITDDTWRIFAGSTATTAPSSTDTASTPPTDPLTVMTPAQDGKSLITTSGWHLFRGPPPQSLHIVFSDGKVTAILLNFAL